MTTLGIVAGAALAVAGGVWLAFGPAKRQSTVVEGGTLSEEQVAAE